LCCTTIWVKTIKELKQLCVKCKLLTNGKKEDLIIQVVMSSPVMYPKTQKQEQQCKKNNKSGCTQEGQKPAALLLPSLLQEKHVYFLIFGFLYLQENFVCSKKKGSDRWYRKGGLTLQARFVCN